MGEEICECGHSKGDHRFLKSEKPTSCLATSRGNESYCKCNQFKLRELE